MTITPERLDDHGAHTFAGTDELDACFVCDGPFTDACHDGLVPMFEMRDVDLNGVAAGSFVDQAAAHLRSLHGPNPLHGLAPRHLRRRRKVRR